MFVHFNGKLVESESILWVDFNKLPSNGYIIVHFKEGHTESVDGPEAINVIMKLCPDALEGQQLEYERHAWAIHNLIGHPLMQVFSWLGLTKLGLKIHDETVPNPITK